MIIKNDQNFVFGAFVDVMFGINKTNSLYIGSRDSFVYVLEPYEKKFEASGLNEDYLRCETEYFSMGSEGFLFDKYFVIYFV